VAALSGLVLAWGAAALGRPEITREYDDLVWQKLSGETFTADQIQEIRTPCGAYDRNAHPRSALLASLIAVRDIELALPQGQPAEIKQLAHCAADAIHNLLQRDPSSSIGWYLLAWTSRLEGGDPENATRYLARSVTLAPRETWMAIKRVPMMQTEILRGRLDFVRGDYRVLAEAERPDLAAILLRDCVVRDPMCETDWNAGLTSRQTKLVWSEMVRGR
jgi:hypothetical protein